MCATCDDRSSTNTKLCGPAQVARNEQAYRIVQHKRGGKTYPWIAEAEGIGVATAVKLFKVGIKNMAPPGAQEELQVLALQLEQMYSEIMDDLGSTTDASEKARLYAAAVSNIKERRALYGGETINIKHTHQTDFDAQMEELHRSFERDQDIRNATRQRRRTGTGT